MGCRKSLRHPGCLLGTSKLEVESFELDWTECGTSFLLSKPDKQRENLTTFGSAGIMSAFQSWRPRGLAAFRRETPGGRWLTTPEGLGSPPPKVGPTLATTSSCFRQSKFLHLLIMTISYSGEWSWTGIRES